jgi:hypothetical protein
MIAAWPWSALAPLNPLRGLLDFGAFNYHVKTLLAGQIYDMGDVPRWYVPAYLVIKLPIMMLAGAASALAFVLWRDRGDNGRRRLETALIVFIAAHAFGQGAVIWVFLSEIFPNRIRAKGTALGSTVHWIMAAVISWTFPLIAARSGGHTFSVYALCMAGQLIWVLFAMPETKGISLEAIEKEVLVP